MPPKLVTIGRSAPRRGPEREALAQRIARVAELTEALDRVRQARAKIGPTYEAINAVERAEEALKEAQEREPRRLVDEILGRGTGKSLVAAAETALTAARDEESRRREMHRLLDQEEGETQSALGLAEMRRRDAIRDVLAADPAVAALYTEYESARQRVADLRQILAEVSASLPRHWDIRPAPPPGRGVEMPWRAAVEALGRDPDAALTADLPSTDLPPAAA